MSRSHPYESAPVGRVTPRAALEGRAQVGGGRVLVACSGGPDSVSLAHLLVEAGVEVVGLVHVDHGLRESSAGESDVVARHAESIGVPFHSERVVVERRGSLEDSARRARRRVLGRLSTDIGAELIALGHTADDQAETVLMRMARGAGTTGIAAMRCLSGEPPERFWRPLLGVRRADLHGLCDQRGWEVVHDPSNEDRRHERNRIRLDVLPLLGERAVPALARAARLAADDEELLESLASLAPIEVRPNGSAAIPLRWLADVHRALGRRAVRRAARLAGARYPFPAERIDDARAGRAVSMGTGFSAWREDGLLVIGRRRPSRGRDAAS
jgi:tRNA(Ile)-lysidine synthase